MAMTGYLSDMAPPSAAVCAAEQPARAEQGCVVGLRVEVAVVLIDALDLVPRAQHEALPRVHARGFPLQPRGLAGARAPARLLDQHADRVRLVEQAQAAAAA